MRDVRKTRKNGTEREKLGDTDTKDKGGGGQEVFGRESRDATRTHWNKGLEKEERFEMASC